MEKPEALLLAESAHLGYRIGWQRQVAAELRRLHAENERLHQINFSHEVKLSVRGYEIQIADLEAQRDALLEALRPFAETDLTNPTVSDTFGFDVLFARAAIARAEGQA